MTVQKYFEQTMEIKPFIKKFQDWFNIKPKIDSKTTLATFKERDVFWCSLGCNIGFEQDGKNEQFSRPILILKKFNPFCFFCIPLSTKIKPDNKFYFPFVFKRKNISAVLSQIRFLDAKRLQEKMGSISPKDFEDIRRGIKNNII